MRNLKLLNWNISKLTSSDSPVVDFAIDSFNDNVFLLTEDNTLYGINLKTNKELFSIPLENDCLLPNKSVVTGIKYVPDLESVCICADGGEILLYNISKCEAEIVGCLDSGILSMSWSPDFELVIFATKNLTLKEMTIDWEEVTEVPIHPSISEEETEKLAKEISESGARVEVSWRGDGKVFACNIPTPGMGAKNEAILRVFNRECIYEATCETEKVMGMERANISWKPSGALIACTQRLPMQNKYEIIFFERNGLRHGEFTINEKLSVQSIQWNSSSEILSLVLHSLEDKTTSLQLWTVNNYHWYLKQDLTFGKVGEASAIISSQWDAEEPFKLRIATAGGDVFQLSFLWECDITSGLSRENQCLVTVIDGKSLLLTPIRRLVPPPPMSASVLGLEGGNSNQIVFSPHANSHEFLVKLSTNQFAWYHSIELPEYVPQIRFKKHTRPLGDKLEGITPPNFDVPPTLKLVLHPNEFDISKMTQFTWITSDLLLAFEFSFDEKQMKQINNIVEIAINEADNAMQLKRRTALNFHSGTPLRLYHNKMTNIILVGMDSGSILRYEVGGAIKDYFTFPTPCSTIATVTFQPASEGNILQEEEIIIGLNSKLNRLYAREFVCSRECNSMALHERFLIYSTLNHTLRFIDLRNQFSEQTLETSLTHINDTSQREVERGSRIVCVVPYDSKLVLQMPRGNLETIYPRALMLSYCRDLLSQHRFQEAFFQMTKHRIDLNLIYDHNPDDFIENVEEFIHQIDSQTNLNIFLSAIIEDDVTQTLFASKEQHKKKSLLPTYLITKDSTGKVNRICSNIRRVLTSSEESSSKYLLSIITTYVQDSPSQLSEALLIIKKLLHNEIHTQGNTATAESALEYIIFLVDVNKLYNVALSIYDLELAVMVAQKSSKDPKEYIPFLSKLNEMPEYQRKYTIDMLLERWESALTHLAISDSEEDFKNAISLIKSKGIYHHAIRVYESKSEAQFYPILKLYAEHLVDLRTFEEAAQIYLRCKEEKLAFECYKSSNNWRKIFTLAHAMKYSESMIKDLGYEVSTTCNNLSQFKEAASILLEYCNDHEKAIIALIKGFQWSEALRLCYKHSTLEVIDGKLKPALLEAYQSSLSIIQDKKATFGKQVERLKVVKRTKILFPQTIQLPDNMANQGNLFSETSSFSSTMSSFSYVSVSSGGTRRRKKQKRKRLTGKEGNPHEEEFLVKSLKGLIPVDVEQEEVHNLIVGLVEMNLYAEASLLQSEYSHFHALVKSSLDLLLAPLIRLPNEEEDELQHEQKIEEKNRMDALYRMRDWPLRSLVEIQPLSPQ